MAKAFLIIGNGGSGTSLLRGLLNAHSKIECLFECWGKECDRTKQFEMAEYQADYWLEIAAKSDLLWGNKLPVEQFITRKWEPGSMARLIDDFKIVWIVRRFSMYCKDFKRKHDLYLKNWNFAREVYWKMRERKPDKIINVSFEDLLLRPETELLRICDFLGVVFEMAMLHGTTDTGASRYNQAKINVERV
jgi:hypothetical protein